MRAQRLLVFSITNLVAMNYNANFLLAIGASPVMAHAHEEVRDMATVEAALKQIDKDSKGKTVCRALEPAAIG